jgi:nicotinamidase-related amidase
VPAVAILPYSRAPRRARRQSFSRDGRVSLLPSDRRLHETRGSAFAGTALERELREQGVDTVIVTGCCAKYCVLSTCRGAEDLGLSAIVLCGALASSTPRNIGFVENVSEVISFGALSQVVE